MDELGRDRSSNGRRSFFKATRGQWEAVRRKDSTRQGDFNNGIILGMERRNFLVDLGKTEAIPPIQEEIRETHRRGDRVGPCCWKCDEPLKMCR